MGIFFSLFIFLSVSLAYRKAFFAPDVQNKGKGFCLFVAGIFLVQAFWAKKDVCVTATGQTQGFWWGSRWKCLLPPLEEKTLGSFLVSASRLSTHTDLCFLDPWQGFCLLLGGGGLLWAQTSRSFSLDPQITEIPDSQSGWGYFPLMLLKYHACVTVSQRTRVQQTHFSQPRAIKVLFPQGPESPKLQFSVPPGCVLTLILSICRKQNHQKKKSIIFTSFKERLAFNFIFHQDEAPSFPSLQNENVVHGNQLDPLQKYLTHLPAHFCLIKTTIGGILRAKKTKVCYE